jgi:hypothetical protein
MSSLQLFRENNSTKMAQDIIDFAPVSAASDLETPLG